MAEELYESVPLESDEADYSEADESFAESDESLAEAEDWAEDIGEARRRRGRSARRNRYRPARGVRGMKLQGQDGRPRTLQFPAKLATADETNRGLAEQERGRRALEQRLERLEMGARKQQRNEASASGFVSLLLGSSLSVKGVWDARGETGSGFGAWASKDSTKAAALISATQLATTAAKWGLTHKYHRSTVGMAADVFAVAQLGATLIGQWYTPAEVGSEETLADLKKQLRDYKLGARVAVQDTGQVYEIREDGKGRFVVLHNGGL